MQFKVPQFIDIEDKVFGNLTFKQFAYLAGGAGLSYISIKVLPVYIWLILVPIFAGLAIALTFVKINEKPFAHILEAFIRYYMNSRLYLWKKEPRKASTKQQIQKPDLIHGTLTESKLQTLSWSLDVLDPNKK